MKKTIAFILTFCLLLICFVPAGGFALTEAEKDTAFTAALMELESYLENPGVPGRSLDGCIAAFCGLGKFNYSDSFAGYASALLTIEEGGFNRMLDAMLRTLDTPEFTKFIEELDSPVLGTPAQLESYKNARKAEAAGDTGEAIARYDECRQFYDSRIRYLALTEKEFASVYEAGTALFNDGNLAGAYFALQECTGYELTDTVLEMIVEELGYVPESPTDNPCKHEWTEAGCETPRTCVLCGETEGEPLGHKWADASCTAPKACTVCGKTEGEPFGHSWQPATYDAPETCSRCGETRGEPVPRISAGDIVTFGSYEQDNNLSNGQEPIEWLVLDMKDGKALLLSKYGLDAKPYNRVIADVTWETCTLRTWLNNDFLKAAFTPAEQARIETTAVDNGSSQWSTSGGNNTEDKIFLLSYGEANQYLGVTTRSNTESRVSPTAYAKANGAYTASDYKTAEGAAAGWWWLRSPGYYQFYAADVRNDGVLLNSDVDTSYECVRPALWCTIS